MALHVPGAPIAAQVPCIRAKCWPREPVFDDARDSTAAFTEFDPSRMVINPENDSGSIKSSDRC
jgi:hypothetical protein